MTVALDAPAVEAARDYPFRFVQGCRIVKENEEVGLLNLEPQQREALRAVVKHRWVMVVKYRQAKISTVMALWLLGQIQYSRALQGVFVAERYETAETVWNRAVYAYENLPGSIRIPLKAGTSAAKRELRFTHNGAVRIVTGGGKAPAIGNSPDRIVVTEFPDVPDHENFNQHFFPTINKRPNARVVFEHTPGMYQTIPHTMWLNTLDGRGRFHGVFLRWWLDASIRPLDEQGLPTDCSDLVPTQEELSIIEELPGIQKHHLMFRRLALDTEFFGDTELFRHKYPFGPYDGWVTTINPAIPKDAVQWLLTRSVVVKGTGETHWYENPDEDEACPYLIVADPAGYGETGDPSAMTIFNAWDRREVATWSGREDPGVFAHRIRKAQKHLGEARVHVAVESNKGECVQALRMLGTPNLYHTSDNHPGYYSTEQSNTDERAFLVEALRRKDIEVRTRDTLHQLLQWDGKGRTKRSKTAEGTHHFDRAKTVAMAARLFRTMNFGTRPAPRILRRGMTIAQLDKLFAKKKINVLGVRTG